MFKMFVRGKNTTLSVPCIGSEYSQQKPVRMRMIFAHFQLNSDNYATNRGINMTNENHKKAEIIKSSDHQG